MPAAPLALRVLVEPRVVSRAHGPESPAALTFAVRLSASLVDDTPVAPRAFDAWPARLWGRVAGERPEALTLAGVFYLSDS